MIDGVMWRGAAQRLAFVPEDGIEVVASGKLTTYPGRSKYQIVIERMEIAGEGALLALLEKTRQRLAAEGLFAAERKRPLPFLPRVIGVVTSPTGAVIRDILHRLADRFPSRVLVWPVLVQGQGAAEQVAAAVRGFAELGRGRADPAPRPADRRARRRLDRGLVGLQRGDCGARDRRIADPGDQRGRARNRHHAGRLRRRPPRADARPPPPRSRCRCARTCRDARRFRPAPAHAARARPVDARARTARGAARRGCRGPKRWSRRRRRSSTTWPNACAAGWPTGRAGPAICCRTIAIGCRPRCCNRT